MAFLLDIWRDLGFRKRKSIWHNIYFPYKWIRNSVKAKHLSHTAECLGCELWEVIGNRHFMKGTVSQGGLQAVLSYNLACRKGLVG